MVGRVAALCAIVLMGCRIGFEPIAPDVGGDAGTSDDAADGPQVMGCPAFALFCDDFELGDLSRWTETQLQGPATAVVSGTRIYGGSYALETRVGAAPSDGGNAMPVLSIPEQSTGVLAVRQWVNVGAALRDFNIVLEIQNTETSEYVAAGGNNSANWVSTEDAGSGAVDHQTNVPTPAQGEWACLELTFEFEPPGAPRVQMFVNDVMVLDDTSAYSSPVFDEVRIGITRADMTGFTLFTDNVVIANQRIGCQ